MKEGTGHALCLCGYEAGFYDEGEFWQDAIAQDLPVAKAQGVDYGDDVGLCGQRLLLGRGDETPQLVDVDDRPPVHVARQMEVAHTDLSEVTRMVLVEVGSGVVLDIYCIGM